MDTLIVPVPRRRAYGRLAIAALLVVVGALSDTGGRLLALPAVLAAVGLAVRDLVAGPLLRADAAGVEVLQGMHTITADWAQVERMRVVKDRRTEMLELDVGSTLLILSRQRLGRPPEDVLADLLSVRDGVRTGSAESTPPAPG